MSREEYCLAFLLELLHQIANFASAQRIQARHGLIEEDQHWIVQDGLGDSCKLQPSSKTLEKTQTTAGGTLR
ncbi:MAG: hypothetical protein DMG79_18990 [Acidobacteria bacterium]|nr:MAG: hypothetical protein DMG79_18990 [Acidobacteriota bacterium]